MEEARVSGSNGGRSPEARASYWLDAYEDVSEEILNGFVDFDSVAPEIVEDSPSQGVDPGFFRGIDGFLENIKNGWNGGVFLSDNDRETLNGSDPLENGQSENPLAGNCIVQVNELEFYSGKK